MDTVRLERHKTSGLDWTCYFFKHIAQAPIPAPDNNNWVPGFFPLALTICKLSQPQQAFPGSQRDPLPSPHIHTVDAKFPTQKSWQSQNHMTNL